MIYCFDRYSNGKRMAMGAKITKATSIDDAFRRADELCAPDRDYYERETFELKRIIFDERDKQEPNHA